MFRMTRVITLLLAVTTLASAQSGRPPVPPTPPAPPAPPSPPSPVAAPRPAQIAEPPYLMRVNPDMLLDLDRTRIVSEEALRRSLDASRAALYIDRDALQQASQSARDAVERMRIDGYAPLAALSGQQVVRGYELNPQFQNDPADSLMRRAQQLLSANDYRAAAQRFKEVQQKYPNSQYISHAMYFQAFALYRSDTDAELREAVNLLGQFQQRFPNARFRGENDFPADAAALSIRINRKLAERGDANARQQVSRAASDSIASCDREELSVKSEALSALWRLDRAGATPKFEQVLARRDECSLNLRLYALQVLTQGGDAKSVATLLATAKSDPSSRMRAEAVNFVSRFPNDEVLTTLESIARNEQTETVKRAAARSLVGYPSPRARTIVRTLVEDNTVTDDLRCEVLGRYNNSDRGTAEDATWLRASFAKVTSNRVKGCIVRAVVAIGGSDSQKWLMDLSTNDAETATLRSQAFRGVATTMSVQDLGRTYDNSGNRPLREQVIQMLNQRKEPEALDKLIDIAKKSSDFEIRRQVIRMLAERKDPKATAALMELIDK